MTSIAELKRKSLEGLSRPSYSISNKNMLLLNDNANLFGVNPAAQEVAETFDFARLWAYPSENSDSLRQRISSEYGVSPDEVIVGNGSDEILDVSSKCFINPGDTFCSPAPTFSMYKFYAKLHLGRIVEKVLRPDFTLDPDPIIAEKAKLTAICQPNNPTAVLFDRSSVKRMLNESYGIVMLDEAYANFCGSNMLSDVLNSEHSIDVRTFSKAYGMAGLRAGFAISRKEVIDEMRGCRTPFGLNAFSEAVAIRALDNKAWMLDVVSRMKAEREHLASRLAPRGFKVYPSDSNYLLCKTPGDGPSLVASLRAEGIAIRDCNSYPLLQNHVRITIAPRPMMDALLERLDKLTSGGKG